MASDKPALGPACRPAAGTADGRAPRVAQAGGSGPALDGRDALHVPVRRTSAKEEPLSPRPHNRNQVQTQEAGGSAEGATLRTLAACFVGRGDPGRSWNWGRGDRNRTTPPLWPLDTAPGFNATSQLGDPCGPSVCAWSPPSAQWR